MTGAPSHGRERTDEEGCPRYLVNVLGHFDVWHADRDATPPSGKPSQLVQVLAIHNGRLHREQVIDALWPNDPVRIGAPRLRNVLSRVRARTGPLIARHGHVLFFAAPHRIDITEFLRLSEHAIRHADHDPTEALTAGTQALMLHRGPLLQDDPYAEWGQDARRHTEEQRQLLVEALAHASDLLGYAWCARGLIMNAFLTPRQSVRSPVPELRSANGERGWSRSSWDTQARRL